MSLRESFADLLIQLVSDRLTPEQAESLFDGDGRASVRLLANALLNFASTAGPEAIGTLRKVLPWLELFARRELGAGTDEAVVSAEHLDAEHWPACSDWIEPDEDVSERDFRQTLVGAARDEARLEALSECDDVTFADRVLDDTATARAVLEAVDHDAPAATARRARRIFPEMAADGSLEALELLDRLEQGDGFSLQPDADALSAKARNFETSLADNMEAQVMSPAVRAALIFAPGPSDASAEADGLSTSLFASSIFRRHPELAGLARALTDNRWRCLRYLRGGAPLSHLSDWVDYLRDGCRELARRRDITYREAVSYAHFCLHLVNVCDLATHEETALTDETREGLMAVENELKEFALAGRRSTVDAAVSDLANYDEMRWASSGASAYLGDRLARMTGAWREESERGPIGAPPRLDEEMYAAAVEIWEREADDSVLTGLRDAATRLHLVGGEALESLEPRHGARLLALAAKYARDLPGLDVTEPFWVDVSSLVDAEQGPEDEQLQKRALREVLEQQSIAEAFSGSWEPETAGGAGILGAVETDRETPVLRLQLDLDAESLALLSFLDDSLGESTDEPAGRLRKELRKKVRRQFGDESSEETTGQGTTAA